MKQRWSYSRRARMAAGTAAVGVTALLVAACGGSGTSKPAGLKGKPTTGASKQENAEERAANSTLTPTAGSFLSGKRIVKLLGPTTPTNGDINPYAIWPVTENVGSVRTGDVLVDNFNNKSNDQGTGTTIVNVHPDGKLSVFAALPRQISGCTGGVGLTTAMVQLKTGWVIVGSLPSKNGKTATAGAGCLIVLSPAGKLSGTISGSYIDGPWDATVADHGTTAQLFVANTLNGIHGSGLTTTYKGNIVRLDLSESATTPPKVTSEATVASGFPERGDPSVFVKGPTGLVVGSTGTLYVANNIGNQIDAISHALTRTGSAGTGKVVTTNGQLANPLGLALAPNGDLLTANATNGKIVELTPAGKQVGEYYADHNVGQDPPGNGDLFDVAVNQARSGVLFVNDGTNTLELLR